MKTVHDKLLYIVKPPKRSKKKGRSPLWGSCVVLSGNPFSWRNNLKKVSKLKAPHTCTPKIWHSVEQCLHLTYQAVQYLTTALRHILSTAARHQLVLNYLLKHKKQTSNVGRETIHMLMLCSEPITLAILGHPSWLLYLPWDYFRPDDSDFGKVEVWPKFADFENESYTNNTNTLW